MHGLLGNDISLKMAFDAAGILFMPV